ncbi:hypothetical protein WN944_001944 [Citrus x changshan-huyou]|uniref:Uncharacterized protein n=1 Tax=Citrus x changshan-huyou TaxID=2935761 RepID=A0AAP0QRA8_9ROSI
MSACGSGRGHQILKTWHHCAGWNLGNLVILIVNCRYKTTISSHDSASSLTVIFTFNSIRVVLGIDKDERKRREKDERNLLSLPTHPTLSSLLFFFLLSLAVLSIFLR